jgi:hypothetical protein
LGVKYKKWPKNTNIFHCKAFQNLPKLDFSLEIHNIWQHRMQYRFRDTDERALKSYAENRISIVNSCFSISTFRVIFRYIRFSGFFMFDDNIIYPFSSDFSPKILSAISSWTKQERWHNIFFKKINKKRKRSFVPSCSWKSKKKFSCWKNDQKRVAVQEPILHTAVSYNASFENIYYIIGVLKTKVFSSTWKKRSGLQQRWQSKCKIISRRIGC